MSQDKQLLGESGFVGEELLTDAAFEMDQQCIAVQETVDEHIFTLEEALDAYGVSQEAYSLFQLKKQLSALQAKAYTHSAGAAEYAFIFGAVGNFFQVFYEYSDRNFLSTTNHGRLHRMVKTIEQIKDDFKSRTEKV